MGTLSLAALALSAHPILAQQIPGDIHRGKTVFDQNCAVCHGIAGDVRGVDTKEMNPVPSNFTDPAFWKGKTDTFLYRTILNGSSREMPGYRDLLTPKEIRDVLEYIKTFRKS
jgi:mono/diheme cytochrome c family protein